MRWGQMEVNQMGGDKKWINQWDFMRYLLIRGCTKYCCFKEKRDDLAWSFFQTLVSQDYRGSSIYMDREHHSQNDNMWLDQAVMGKNIVTLKQGSTTVIS